MKPKLVNLDIPNLRDCSEMLHRLADDAQRLKAVHTIVVMETEDGKLDIRGYGDVKDTTSEIGLLQMAILELAFK